MFNKKNHQLSIVIPILNEAKNINILIPKIVNCIKNKIKKYEIIIVDDDSDDDISKIIFKLKKKYKFIKFIQFLPSFFKESLKKSPNFLQQFLTIDNSKYTGKKTIL